MIYLKQDNTQTICALVCFIFVFIILVIAIAWTNYSNFENFGDVTNANLETMKNVMSGGLYYKVLSKNDNIIEMLRKKDKVALVALLAPWCGYCQKLKDSGVLRQIAKKYPVFVMDDQHPQIADMMHILQAEGFPTLGIYNTENVIPYNGGRDYSSIMNILDQFKGEVVEVPSNVDIIEKLKNLPGKYCTIFLAEWCGHCKNLKKSGEIEKLAKMGIKVFCVSEDNPGTKKLQIPGFPSIICWKNGKEHMYEGPRKAKEISKFIKSL